MFGQDIDKSIETKKQKESELSRSLNGFKLELEEINDKKKVAEKDLLVLDTKIAEQNQVLNTLTDSIGVTQKSLEDINVDISKKNGVLDTLNKDITEKTKEFGVLADKQIAEATQISEDLQSQKVSKEKEINILNDKINTLKSDIETLKVTKTSLSESLLVIEKDIDEKKQKLINLNTEFSEVSTALQSAKAGLLNVQTETVNTQIHLDGLKEDIEEDERVADELVKSIEQLEASKVEAKAELDDLVQPKIQFAEQKKQLDQKEEHLKVLYQEAGLTYPE